MIRSDSRSRPQVRSPAPAGSLTLEPIALPLEQARLDNGLGVVVHPVRGAPVVAVHMMVHAGSRHEPPDRTGIAHLLEHLLFEESAHCPKGTYDALLERVGGSGNGSTWWDRTNYYEVVPLPALELALWLERERFLHTIPHLDSRTVEIQRDVVLNERLQTYDNRPYGRAEERLQAALFPGGHPYRHPTIGSAEHIASLGIDDAVRYFDRWYRPANTVLVLAGDVDPDSAVQLASRYLGDLPSAPAPDSDREAHEAVGRPSPPERDVSMRDRVTLPRAYLGWRVPPYGTAAWVALDILAYFLSDGETSVLHRTLVRDRQIAVAADAYLYPSELEGVFGVTVTGRGTVSADFLRDAALDVVSRVAAGSVDERDIAGAIRRARRDHLEALSSMEERAEVLAYAALTLGDVARFPEVLERYRAITPQEVVDAARILAAQDPAVVRVDRAESG